jgi:hypothetical protein
MRPITDAVVVPDDILLPMWTTDDIEIALEDELTDGPVVTARIATPAGTLLIMAEIEKQGRELLLSRTHIHGETLGPNDLGPHRLRQIAKAPPAADCKGGD